MPQQTRPRGYTSPTDAPIGRTDQGVDWGTKPGDVIRAIGAGVVDFVGRYAGFGNYVAYHLTSGPAAGQEIYTAEFGTPTVRVGQRLRQGQALGREAAGTPSGIEVGFAQRGGSFLPLAQSEGGYTEGQVTAAGQRFRDLLGGGSGAAYNTLGKLWTDNGGPAKLANLMAAIALAESGGQVDAKHTNDDGSVDYGLWQINSAHKAYDPQRLLDDPNYNAKAAVAVYKSQGLGAWTTYSSGRYRDYLHGAAGHSVTAPRTRPGGENSDPNAAAGEAQDIAWRNYLLPGGSLLGGWDPFSIFGDAKSAVNDAGTFFKWIAWIFHPRNLLRMVEFLAGFGLLVMGVAIYVKVFAQRDDSGPVSKGSSGISKLAVATPVGRAAKGAQAARQGRGAARQAHRARQTADRRTAARKGEATRLSNKDFERRTGKKRGPQEEIPF